MHEAIAPILICPFFFLFFYFNPTRDTVLQSLRLCFFFFFLYLLKEEGKGLLRHFFFFYKSFSFLNVIHVKMCIYIYILNR